MNFYLIHVYGDVVPVLSGPYTTEADRDKAAREIRHADADLRDGVFRLDIDKEGNPAIDSYSDAEMEAK